MSGAQSLNRKATLVGWLPLAWYLFFLSGPFVLVVLTSFASRGLYGGIEWTFSVAGYARAFDVLYLHILLRSFIVATLTAAACLLIGLPMAWAMATASQTRRSVYVLLLAIPFLTNLVIRVCALKAITSYDGPLASLLTLLQIQFDPYLLSQNQVLVVYGMISSYLPFMVFPIYAALERFDFSLLEAAQDLGASTGQMLRLILIPVLRRPIFSGLTLVFIPCLGEFVIPDLLGGAKSMLAGNLISEQFLKARDWPFGSVLSALLVVALFLISALSKRLENREGQNA